MFRDWGIASIRVPEYDDMSRFIEWVEKMYVPLIKDRLGVLKSLAQNDPNLRNNEKFQRRLTALQNQEMKATLAVSDARANPDDWVYWCDQTEKDGEIANLKPLRAAPYAPVLFGGAKHRIFMSAYPGDREIFCESMGLDIDNVAWIKLPSGFEPKKRPVVMGMVGSMSKRNLDQTFPAFIRVVDKILTSHKDEKGIIHCNSYKLGEQMCNHFRVSPHGIRLKFAKNADERDAIKKEHEETTMPSVIISPSMTEGFDFKDDLARWQIVAKMPYPYLGDHQVARKKELNPAWYALQTAMTIIQACGRIVRSADDYGVTYILDSDFQILWDRHRKFFPTWFQAAMVWPKKG